jgi:hypothetical protein
MYLQRSDTSAHARCSRHVIVTHREAGAARATTSALLMLAGRRSGDSTSWELPQRKGMNLGMRQEAACLTRCSCSCALVVVEAPNTVASGRLQEVAAWGLRGGGGGGGGAAGGRPTRNSRSLEAAAQGDVGRENNEDDGGGVGGRERLQLAQTQQQRDEVELVACAVVDALPVAEAVAQVSGRLPD